MPSADRRGSDPRGQRDTDARVQYLWQGVALLGVIGVAIVLFLVTLWLSEGQGPVSPSGAFAVVSPAAHAPRVDYAVGAASR